MAYYRYQLDKGYYDQYVVAPCFSSEYVSVRYNQLIIREGYAWSGCSPKLSVFDMFTMGTPEGVIDYTTGKPKTYYASLVHDALYQHGIGSRKEADKIFYSLLKQAEFKSARAYYIAVRMFGWMKFTKWDIQ